MLSLVSPPPAGGDLFEGPEKTLTICFKKRKISAGSLRLIPRETWSQVLAHARCEILSVVDSIPLDLSLSSKGKKKTTTKGITGYLLSESSLFLSDTTLSLKTCGRTTPLESLEPILNIVSPKWQQKCLDEIVTYASFSRFGYMFPEDQPKPHDCWDNEVAFMNRYLRGEATVLGSGVGCCYHVYVANYLPQGEIIDAFSTQVACTQLDPIDGFRNFSEIGSASPRTSGPLKTMWKDLHGNETRCVANAAAVDEKFFEPYGYSANGVFGHHFTTVHASPQESCSYLSVETSMPLTCEARDRFVVGAQDMCHADRISLTEFALCPALFAKREPPQVSGFCLQRSSHSIGATFACALHHYVREAAPRIFVGPGSSAPLISKQQGLHGSLPAVPELQADENPRLPLFEVQEQVDAHLAAARHFFSENRGHKFDQPVALLDVGVLRRKAEAWRQHLPRVEPFYAVKCNNDPVLVETLWQVWQEWGFGGFDCASPAEWDIVAKLGVDLASKVIYANPCKQESAVEAAREAGVRWVVFDNALELCKMSQLYPEAQLFLRLQTDDSEAQCQLSNKFGARPEDVAGLFAMARELGACVVGVSFHVGSGCSHEGAFHGALRSAKEAFDEAERHGFQLRVLDIGGGFPGWDELGKVNFADHAKVIRTLLEEWFPSREVRVIAEPGRFFAATAQAALTTVVSVAESNQGHRYYLNDGLYGSFNCLLYDHASLPEPTILRESAVLPANELGSEVPCTVFGPTCDGFDVVAQAGTLKLPALRPGDRLLFPNMGAYTTAASTSFNGFAPAQTLAFESRIVNRGS